MVDRERISGEHAEHVEPGEFPGSRPLRSTTVPPPGYPVDRKFGRDGQQALDERPAANLDLVPVQCDQERVADSPARRRLGHAVVAGVRAIDRDIHRLTSGRCGVGEHRTERHRDAMEEGSHLSTGEGPVRAVPPNATAAADPRGGDPIDVRLVGVGVVVAEVVPVTADGQRDRPGYEARHLVPTDIGRRAILLRHAARRDRGRSHPVDVVLVDVGVVVCEVVRPPGAGGRSNILARNEAISSRRTRSSGQYSVG